MLRGLCIGENKKATVIIVYNNGKIKEVIEGLRSILEEIEEKNETVLLMGDFNARIGRWQISSEGEAEECRETEDLTVNNEGNKLIKFCEEIGGTMFAFYV